MESGKINLGHGGEASIHFYESETGEIFVLKLYDSYRYKETDELLDHAS